MALGLLDQGFLQVQVQDSHHHLRAQPFRPPVVLNLENREGQEEGQIKCHHHHHHPEILQAATDQLRTGYKMATFRHPLPPRRIDPTEILILYHLHRRKALEVVQIIEGYPALHRL